MATVIGSMTYPLGSAFAFILPALYLKDSDKENPSAGKAHMRDFLIVQSSMIAATSVLMLLFFRSKPASPPSASAVIERSDFCTGAKRLICNGNYWVLTIAFMFYWSLYVSMGVIISQVTDLYNYPSVSQLMSECERRDRLCVFISRLHWEQSVHGLALLQG